MDRKAFFFKHTLVKTSISCQASTHLPTHVHAKHVIYATQTLHSLTVFVPNCTVCVL